MPQGLLSQDVVVLAKLVSYSGERPPIAQLASDLGLSPSQVHASLKRLGRSRLIEAQTCRPVLRAVEEFLIHGVKYAFPAQRGEATRGMATAHAAPPLKAQIIEERRREFFLEGRRFGDVIRYNLSVVPAPGTPFKNGGTYGPGTGIQICFPLPDVERNNNPNIPKTP